MGNCCAKKEYKKEYHWKFSDFLVKSTDGSLVLWKKNCLLDRSTEINTQFAHFIRWSLRLKNELPFEKIAKGYAGVGIISENHLYEVSANGFTKKETFGRLKELRSQNCVIAIQKMHEIDPEFKKLDQAICDKLDELVDKYQDFTTVNLDIGDQFLGEVLKRTKEILNHVDRNEGSQLLEALRVFYDFFAREDKILQTNELCNMINFMKLPNDMLSPLLDECIADLVQKDTENTKVYHLEETLDVLERYEIIQQLELSEYEKESVFNCQFFLRVLHEVGMIDLRPNNLYFNQDDFNRSRAALRDDEHENDDVLIDRNIEVEDIPDYFITDVNDLIYPLSNGASRVFCKGYTFEKEKVLYFE